MITQQQVHEYLKIFKVKMAIYEVLFRDDRTSKKNTKALLALDIKPNDRKQILRDLVYEDYYQGPLDDDLYGISSMWVFGKKLKGKEIYIKISMGSENSSVICISFHEAEYEMTYPFKTKKL
jgi:hypothetical protein